MHRLLAVAAFLTLPACGFNGTDPDDAEVQGSAQKGPTEATDPDFAEFEQSDIPDSEPRPQMQLQVVLDQQGFGPGIIDGEDGLSTANALKGFQEAHSLEITGELDEPTRQALARWRTIPATRVVRIPESWGRIEFNAVPDAPEDQAKMERLGYESLEEKLAERFHTTVEVLERLNPGSRPAGSTPDSAVASASPVDTEGAATASASGAGEKSAPAPAGTTPSQAAFRPGQLVRVPNVGLEASGGHAAADDRDWARTLASLGVAAKQPEVAKVVVDKSESWLKAYDEAGRLVAMFTVTSGSSHDPLPLGEWGINGVSHNPPFSYDPELFWDVPDSEEKQQLPPGPNGPVGVVWIDLTKEHYGIHGTGEPPTIGRAQSHGCVRLTNWDAARLAGMVDGSTKVLFQA